MHAPYVSALVAVSIGASSAWALVRDPFAQAEVVSTVGLARLAEDAGDALLLAHLVKIEQRQLTLSAARASPFARSPELLIPALATHACGRDPDLAAQAAHALRAIAERLEPSALARREVLLEDLRRARQALTCVDVAPPPRADIVAELAQLAAALDGLLRP
jgi:hypothetical protein